MLAPCFFLYLFCIVISFSLHDFSHDLKNLCEMFVELGITCGRLKDIDHREEFDRVCLSLLYWDILNKGVRACV